MAEIIWAPSALKDIAAIAEYISNDSVLAAENMVALFFEKATVLEKYPLIGKQVPEIRVNYLRELLVLAAIELFMKLFQKTNCIFFLCIISHAC